MDSSNEGMMSTEAQRSRETRAFPSHAQASSSSASSSSFAGTPAFAAAMRGTRGRQQDNNDSIGASFLAMDTDSSPNTSRSLKDTQSATRSTHHQPRSSVGGSTGGASERARANAGFASSSTSTSSSPSSSPLHHVTSRFQSIAALGSSGSLAHMMSIPPESESNVQHPSEQATHTTRPRPNTRGAKLGMQMGKSKGTADQLAADTLMARATAHRPNTVSRMPQKDDDQKLSKSFSTDKASQPILNATHISPPAQPSSALLRDIPSHESKESSAAPLPVKGDKVAFPTSSEQYAGDAREDATEGKGINVPSDGQLSDATIAELGATPGVEPNSLLNADGQPLSSKNILTIALQKAQSAVLLDSSNNVPEAIAAYRQAVRLLQEVMDRVSPKNTKGSSSSSSAGSKRQNRDEERRRLKVIHETYAERIRLLSMIYTPDEDSNDALEPFEAHDSSETPENREEFVHRGIFDTTGGHESRDRNDVGSGDVHETPARSGVHASTPVGPVINILPDESNLASDEQDDFRRLDEELVTPATPYFDADPTLEGEDGDEKVVPSSRKPLGLNTAVLPFETEAPRPTARDASKPKTPSLTSAPLVSASVESGTILQRRKSNLVRSASTEALPGKDGSWTPTLPSSPVKVSAIPPVPVLSNVTDSAAQTPEIDANQSTFAASASRKRAISQPNQRRPGIPASFLPGRSKADAMATAMPSPPPLPLQYQTTMPKIKRKHSMPLNLLAANQIPSRAITPNAPQRNANTQPAATLGVQQPLPSPAPSAYSGYHMLGTPMSVMATSYVSAGLGGLSDEKATVINDLFINPLPSMMLRTPPSFTSNSTVLGLPWLGVSNALPDSSVLARAPAEKHLRPFYTMRQLQASIAQGAYVSRRLYVSREMWLQSGSRLLALDTKVRMIDLVSAAIESADHAGAFLLEPAWRQPGGGTTTAIHVAKFVKHLDDVELIMNEAQSTLSKKLGFLDTTTSASSFVTNTGSAVGGADAGSGGGGSGAISSTFGSPGTNGPSSTLKKSNLHTFNTLSSKLQRSLGQMVSSHHSSSKASNVDLPTAYVDSLGKLFVRAQMFDEHLRAVAASRQQRAHSQQQQLQEGNVGGGGGGSYEALSHDVCAKIETRLQRASDFFANVILRFVVRDLTILVDKYIKRNAGLLVE